MSILMFIIAGLVYGLAEFLPVSGSGHLVFLQEVLGLPYIEGTHYLFEALLNVGMFMVLYAACKSDIRRIAGDVSAYGKEKTDKAKPSIRLLILIGAAIIPLLICIPFLGRIFALSENTLFVGFALLVSGGLVYVSDMLPQGKKAVHNTSVIDAVVIGVGQCLSLLPGLSRSAAVISLGMSLELNRNFAVRFSFLIALPMFFIRFVFNLIKCFGGGIIWSLVPAYIIGAIFASAAAYVAINLIRQLVNKGRIKFFAYYCWIIGVLTIVLSWII